MSFWSQFAHISPSAGIKNCLLKAEVNTSFWNLCPDCIKIWHFCAQIQNIRTTLRLYEIVYVYCWFLWVTTCRILILVKSQNHVFAFREQHQRFRYQPTVVESSLEVNVFFIRCSPLFLEKVLIGNNASISKNATIQAYLHREAAFI